MLHTETFENFLDLNIENIESQEAILPLKFSNSSAKLSLGLDRDAFDREGDG